ncbi:metalloprotease TIKI1-like isoform X1 [Ciona intestinalis]
MKLKLFMLMVCCIQIQGSKTMKHHACIKKHRNSFLWKLKREPPVYFFGTIHVPYTRVWDYIPTNTRKSFIESDNVYFELNLNDVTTGMALSRCAQLPVGMNVKEVLPPDIYFRLKRHLNYVRGAMTSWMTSEQINKGLTASLMYNEIAGGWERKRPIWIMLMINALTKPDIRSRGLPVLDVHLARQAGVMGKHVGAIETVEEQCEPFNGLNKSQVIFALNQTLLIQEKVREGLLRIPYNMDDMVVQYNCGNTNSSLFGVGPTFVPLRSNHHPSRSESDDVIDQNDDVTDFDISDSIDDVTFIDNDPSNASRDVTNDDVIMDNAMASEIDDYLKEELIFRRNKRMATRVKDLIRRRKDESLFFAFGAVHFLGEKSVLDLLSRDGFEIENVRSKSHDRRAVKSGNHQSRDAGHLKKTHHQKSGKSLRRINELWKQMKQRSEPDFNEDPFFRSPNRHFRFESGPETASEDIGDVIVVNRDGYYDDEIPRYVICYGRNDATTTSLNIIVVGILTFLSFFMTC